MSLEPHDHRDKWDTADLRAAEVAYKEGEPIEEVASLVGRTIKAVKSKFYRSGIKRK